MQIEILLLCLGILVLGIIIFLIQVFRDRHHQIKEQNKNIKDYKGAREKLTLRKKIKASKIYLKENFDILRVGRKLVAMVIMLYVGGTIMQTMGSLMNNTESEYYSGLSLLGWKVVPTAGNNKKIIETNSNLIMFFLGIVGVLSVFLEFVNITKYKKKKGKGV